MKEIIRSFRALIVLSILCGLIYPMGMTVFAKLVFPYQSKGSIIKKDGQSVGSVLLGQPFTNIGYFHSRPSSGNYDPLSSGGTSLGPTSKTQMNRVYNRILQARKDNNLASNIRIPSDMVTASGSGLDPQISIVNAQLQAPRIAKARNIDLKIVTDLVAKNTDPDFFGFWGQSGVNVLKLNLALDALSEKTDGKK